MSSIVELVLKFLTHRRLRSFLTTLGIAIGVALVVSLVSLNRGMLAYVSDQLDQLGGDMVTITPKIAPGAPFTGTSFSEDDLDAVERLYFVEEVMGLTYTNLNVEIRNEEHFLPVVGSKRGVTEAMGDVSTFGIERGRDFTEGESGKVVLGHYLAEEYNLGPGSQVELEGARFRVIGVMSEVGNRQDDRQIYAPIEDIWAITGREGDYGMIYAKVTEPRVEDVERALERVRGREDFDVLTAESMMETVGEILAVMNAVFLAVASISVLVGSVGIANTMYMAVAERTRDIGIMKAVGASSSDVLKVFLLESGFLSLVGGLAGAGLGYGLAKGISYIAGVAAGFKSLQPVFTPDLVLITAAMSFVVGILSGLFPARYASQLEPVDALRYQ